MPLHLVIDMRCLQDAVHAERGIPGHAGALVRRARATGPLGAARIIAVTDPALPALPAEFATVADELRPNFYLPELPPGSLFLNPWPMGPGQAAAARLLLDPKIRAAGIIYDFIPMDEPARYLAAPAPRLDYAIARAWLARYRLFLPISAPTAERLATIAPGVPRVVTGVPLSLFGQAPASPAPPPRHLLMVGGDDARKNPELLIRAHAGSAVLQARRVALLITGDYPPARREALRALAAAAGGDAALLDLPGRLPAAALAEAYRAAYGVVTPSRAEGFSLPVVEAVAAGVASLASDIPAHAALLADPTWRFAPDDVAGLAALCETLVGDAGGRARLIAAQAGIAGRFEPARVAETFWSAVAALATPAAPAVTRGRRPRLALLSPLPPARSGIADFSARLLPALARRAEVTAFAPERAGGTAPPGALPHLSPRFDRVVSALGNSAHFGTIFDLLRRHGGACICHDSRLLGFALTRFGAAATAAMAARELGRPVSVAEVLVWGADESGRNANLLGEIAAAAQPLIFHNRHTVAEVWAGYGIRAAHLPFPIYRDWPAPASRQARQRETLAARARLGLGADEIVIVSFGFAEPSKGVASALRALALLREAGVRARLLWAGQAGAGLAGFEALAAALGIAEQVRFNATFLSESGYRDHLLAGDFGLQLRIGRRGNVSGALQDCIAAGLPSVANDDLADNLDAPDYVRRVGDALDPAAIRDGLLDLIRADAPRAAFEATRQAYCAAHGMATYADRLCDLLGI